VAPSFHAAIVASKKPMQLGKPIVTSEFGVTPTSWYTRASRLVRISNAAGSLLYAAQPVGADLHLPPRDRHLVARQRGRAGRGPRELSNHDAEGCLGLALGGVGGYQILRSRVRSTC